MATKNYNQVSIHAAVCAMLELPTGARKAARDAIAVTVLNQISRLSRGWCRAGGDFNLTQLEEVEAEAICFYLETLQEIASGRGPEGVRSWDAYLSTKVTFQISAWMRSTTVTGIPGSATISRRARHAVHVIQRFQAEHGRDPSPSELVVASNAEMVGRRTNPAKQGALLPLHEAQIVLGHDAARLPRMSFL